MKKAIRKAASKRKPEARVTTRQSKSPKLIAAHMAESIQPQKTPKVERPAPAQMQNRKAKLALILGGVMVCILAAGAYFSGFIQQSWKVKSLTVGLVKQAAQMRTLQGDLETARMEVSHLQLGSRTLSGLIDSLKTDWDRPPGKPSFLKAGTGLIVFWDDGLIWRRYYLYQKREDRRGAPSRYNPRATKRSFIYIANPPAGTWEYSVTALNKEGKETPSGEHLTVQLPLP